MQCIMAVCKIQKSIASRPLDISRTYYMILQVSNTETGSADAGQGQPQERALIEAQIRTRYGRLTWRQRITGMSFLAIGLINGFMGSETFRHAGEMLAGREQPRSMERNIANWVLVGGSAVALRELSRGAKNAKTNTYSVCDELVRTYAEKYHNDDPDVRYYHSEPVIEDGEPRIRRVHDTATFDGSRRDHAYTVRGTDFKQDGRNLFAAAGGFVIGVAAGSFNESLSGGATTTMLVGGTFGVLLGAGHQLLEERTNRAYVSDFVHQLDNLDYGSGPAAGPLPPPEV